MNADLRGAVTSGGIKSKTIKLFFSIGVIALLLFGASGLIEAKGKKPPKETEPEPMEEISDEDLIPSDTDETVTEEVPDKEAPQRDALIDMPAKPEKIERKEPAAEVRKQPAQGAAQTARVVEIVWVWQETRDCLWRLARKHYGDPWKWKKIFIANRSSILDPNVIYPKQRIEIPSPAE